MNSCARIFRCWLAFPLLAWLTVSCRTLPPLPPVDLTDPGWQLRQGQAVWQRERGAPEIAGEVLFARHTDGRTVLQLSKNPLPFVTARTGGTAWQVEFVPQRRHFSGHGVPTLRLLWVHLARALAGETPPAALRFTRADANSFSLENPDSGEMISGYLNE